MSFHKKSPLFFNVEAAVGITSRIMQKLGNLDDRKRCAGHWLLFDVDTASAFSQLLFWARTRNLYSPETPITFYKTPRGAHLIIYTRNSFQDALRILQACPFIDQEWVELGARRGYWVLAQVAPHQFECPMEFIRFKRVRKCQEQQKNG